MRIWRFLRGKPQQPMAADAALWVEYQGWLRLQGQGINRLGWNRASRLEAQLATLETHRPWWRALFASPPTPAIPLAFGGLFPDLPPAVVVPPAAAFPPGASPPATTAVPPSPTTTSPGRLSQQSSAAAAASSPSVSHLALPTREPSRGLSSSYELNPVHITRQR